MIMVMVCITNVTCMVSHVPWVIVSTVTYVMYVVATSATTTVVVVVMLHTQSVIMSTIMNYAMVMVTHVIAQTCITMAMTTTGDIFGDGLRENHTIIANIITVCMSDGMLIVMFMVTVTEAITTVAVATTMGYVIILTGTTGSAYVTTDTILENTMLMY